MTRTQVVRVQRGGGVHDSLDTLLSFIFMQNQPRSAVDIDIILHYSQYMGVLLARTLNVPSAML